MMAYRLDVNPTLHQKGFNLMPYLGLMYYKLY